MHPWLAYHARYSSYSRHRTHLAHHHRLLHLLLHLLLLLAHFLQFTILLSDLLSLSFCQALPPLTIRFILILDFGSCCFCVALLCLLLSYALVNDCLNAAEKLFAYCYELLQVGQ